MKAPVSSMKCVGLRLSIEKAAMIAGPHVAIFNPHCFLLNYPGDKLKRLGDCLLSPCMLTLLASITTVCKCALDFHSKYERDKHGHADNLTLGCT